MLINSSHVKMCQSYRALLLHDIEKSCIIMVNTLKKLSLVLCEYLGRCPDLPRYPDYKAEQVAGLQPFSPPTTFQHHPHHPMPNTSPRHAPTHLPNTSSTHPDSPPRHTPTRLHPTHACNSDLALLDPRHILLIFKQKRLKCSKHSKRFKLQNVTSGSIC